MSRLFDRLQGPSENSESEGGIKASYLLDLPPEQRRVMRILLRHVELTYADLCKALEALPENERIEQAEIDKALKALTEQNWLIRTEVEQVVRYKTNFQRKSESAAEKPARRKVSPTVRGVWEALEAKDNKKET